MGSTNYTEMFNQTQLMLHIILSIFLFILKNEIIYTAISQHLKLISKIEIKIAIYFEHLLKEA